MAASQGASVEQPEDPVLCAEPAESRPVCLPRGRSGALPWAPPPWENPAGPRAWGAGALTHFEVGGFQRRAGEQPGEHHVDGDREAPTHISISDLNVLDLRGVAGIAFRTPCTRQKAPCAQRTGNVRQPGPQALGDHFCHRFYRTWSSLPSTSHFPRQTFPGIEGRALTFASPRGA